MQDLINKLNNKDAKIGIIGLGYVGLPLAICFQKAGYETLGLDIDKSKVESLNSGHSYIHHILESDIQDINKLGFHATTDFSKTSLCDALIICVPTPLSKHREPDLTYIRETMKALLPYLRENQVLSLESTTYPGTTDEVIVPEIESKNLKAGESFFIVYSPEREDPGNKKFSTRTIPKIVGGTTNSCKEVGIALYQSIVDTVVPVSNTKTAEMVKLLENIHRSVNIGLVNEMKVIANKMDINIHEVIKAADSKPFGFTAYYPGPGVGGHCIPIDPFYLTWKAREHGLHTRFIELAGEVNNSMTGYVIDKIASGLNSFKKSISGSKILVLGIAYKKNVDDARESPSVLIMEELKKKNAQLSYSDPYLEEFPRMRNHNFELKSVDLTPDIISSYDCVVLATDHDDFDYESISKYSKLIVDTRGRFKPANNIVPS